MDALTDEFESHNINSVFVYTHEAHPGEHYPHHISFEQKMKHAEAFRNTFGIKRQILVDALDGQCHRAYGSMPNMSWIFSKAGISVYKSDWTSADSIRDTLLELTGMVKRRRTQRLVMAPFKVEKLEYRISNKQRFIEGLKIAGPKAIKEYIGAFGGK